MTRRTIPCLTAAPWPASPQLRGLCAQTTLLLSPIQEAPLSLGELLNWFSEVSKSWIGSSGGPDTTAPLLHPPTKCCWMSISTSFLVAADLAPSSRLPGEGENSHFAATLEQLIGAVATALGPMMLERGREGGSRTRERPSWWPG